VTKMQVRRMVCIVAILGIFFLMVSHGKSMSAPSRSGHGRGDVRRGRRHSPPRG
jgi:hypothetical protein